MSRAASLPDVPVLRRLQDGTLTAEEWTHEAHLEACRDQLLAEPDPARSLDVLRHLIQAHNARVGTRPGHGYSETLTRYYVAAVASLLPASTSAVLGHPRCSSDAPWRHWRREDVFSDAARQGWVEPTLDPVDFPLPF